MQPGNAEEGGIHNGSRQIKRLRETRETTSDAQGRWEIPADLPNGKFYTIAKQRSIDTPRTPLVCRKAISPRVAF